MPAFFRTADLTRLASTTEMPNSPFGQLDRTDESEADSSPEEVRVLATQVRPRAESQDDLSLALTA
jgi:hypothetical protein